MASKSALFTTRNVTSKNKVFALIDECRKVNNGLKTIKTQTIDNHFHDFHIPEENIHRPIHQMGFDICIRRGQNLNLFGKFVE